MKMIHTYLMNEFRGHPVFICADCEYCIPHVTSIDLGMHVYSIVDRKTLA